jgi:hypothetical protein
MKELLQDRAKGNILGLKGVMQDDPTLTKAFLKTIGFRGDDINKVYDTILKTKATPEDLLNKADAAILQEDPRSALLEGWKGGLDLQALLASLVPEEEEESGTPEKPAAPTADSPAPAPAPKPSGPSLPSPLETETAFYGPNTQDQIGTEYFRALNTARGGASTPGAYNAVAQSVADAVLEKYGIPPEKRAEAMSQMVPQGVEYLAGRLNPRTTPLKTGLAGGLGEVLREVLNTEGGVPVPGDQTPAPVTVTGPTPAGEQAAPVATAQTDTSKDAAFWKWMYGRKKVSNPTGKPETMRKLVKENPGSYATFLEQTGGGSSFEPSKVSPDVAQFAGVSPELISSSKKDFSKESIQRVASRISSQFNDAMQYVQDATLVMSGRPTTSELNQARVNLKKALGKTDQFLTIMQLKDLDPKDVATVYREKLQDPAIQEIIARRFPSAESTTRFQEAARTAREQSIAQIEAEVKIKQIPLDQDRTALEIKKIDYMRESIGLQRQKSDLLSKELDLKRDEMAMGKALGGVMVPEEIKMFESGLNGMKMVLSRLPKGSVGTDEELRRNGLLGDFKSFQDMANKATARTGIKIETGTVYIPSVWENLLEGVRSLTKGRYEETTRKAPLSDRIDQAVSEPPPEEPSAGDAFFDKYGF